MASMIEGLEQRQLLAAATLLRVSSVTADNRGEVVIQLSEKATGVKGAAVQLYTAGADGKLFTTDDKRESVRFTYSVNKKQIKLTGHLAKDSAYRVKLDGKTRIKSAATGALLDGDFKGGTTASGDGKAGGNYEFQAGRDKSSTPLVKMRTSEGDVTIKIRGDVAPVSANVFLGLANTGKYDNLLITRVAQDFVIQTGSIQVTGDGNDPTDLIENDAPSFGQELPRVLSNVRGTLSYARNGSDQASNEFFFNVDNNDGTTLTNNLNSDSDLGDPSGDSVFTPFAQVTSKAGLATIDAINGKATTPLTNAVVVANAGPTAQGGLSNVPLSDPSKITDGTFRPSRDGVIIYRTAPLMVVGAKG